MLIIRERKKEDDVRLVEIWTRAVGKSHELLTSEDIRFFLPLVRDKYLPALEVWVAEPTLNDPIGFIALSGAKVEMLFVDPEHAENDIDRTLLRHAETLKGRLNVDVSEKSIGADTFYLRFGVKNAGDLKNAPSIALTS